MIDAMREDYPVTELCAALAVSRSGYHAWRGRAPWPRAVADADLLGRIREIHAGRHTRCYGSPRMAAELRAEGRGCSVNRVARLMAGDGIRAGKRGAFRPRTTRADSSASPSPNLLKDSGPPAAPGLQLVGDITYIPTREGWLYLAVVIDLFSRAVLGWQTSDSLHTDIVTGALAKALDSPHVAPGAIFHSDRGCQYTAGPTREMLADNGILQSMGAAGNCYDNAFAESFFASYKAEALGGGLPADRSSARLITFDYLECFYGKRRRHSSLGQMSPDAYLQRYLLDQATVLN